SGDAISAEMTPASMLSPPSLVATRSPAARIAAASMRVVVDLPFVPVMIAAGRPPPNCPRIRGSSFWAMSPPIIPPEPRPVLRDAHVAALAAAVARRDRGLMRRGLLLLVMGAF